MIILCSRYNQTRADRITSDTLIGCVFICRVSPERLFLQYILDLSDQTRADKLAIVCGLDINNLYQIAANLKLERGDVQQAARFFQQSKVWE